MIDLALILEKNNYRKIKFRITKTQHILVRAEINGIKGRFILDTGASNTCVCSRNVELLKLNVSDSDARVIGAGTSNIFTQIGINNTIKIGKWKTAGCNIVILDLSHVNLAMTQSRIKPVDGIIGADILIKGNALVDYANHYLYLQ